MTDVVPFVVIKFDPRVDKAWAVPEPEVFKELMNRVMVYCLQRYLTCQRAFRWSNLWGKDGLLGLASKDVPDIIQYREAVEAQTLGPTKFTLFPKEALEKRGNVTVLLRENFRSFDVRWLPKAILVRSGMKGELKLTHIKHYQDSDKTREGKSKRDWRLAMLQGCPRFMEDLKKFDHEHKFPIGAGHIIIRGGAGRPQGTVDRGRGSRGGRPKQQGDHHHQHHQQQQQRQQQQQKQHQPGRARSDRRDRSEERSYDRDFPTMGRGRDRDKSKGGGWNWGRSAGSVRGNDGPGRKVPSR